MVCDTAALPGGAVALPGAAGAALTDVAFAPGGDLLAAGGRDGQVPPVLQAVTGSSCNQ